jgi:hypothetical protein
MIGSSPWRKSHVFRSLLLAVGLCDLERGTQKQKTQPPTHEHLYNVLGIGDKLAIMLGESRLKIGYCTNRSPVRVGVGFDA